ncbi:MAG: sugar phosphate isomerase/epimerase [bacterium]
MQRRAFLKSVGAAAGVLALPNIAYAEARLGRIGLELYTVRKAMRANPEQTLAAIRAIGYTDVELLWSFGNFGRTPKQVKATLDHEGLRAPSAHMDPETITKDWERSLDTAKLLGHEYLVVPSLPSEAEKSLDGWLMWADRFNTAGAAARKAGLWLAFHNEPTHMKMLSGKVPYDTFVERLDPAAVRLQLDVGNMLLGGADPMAYLKRYSARYWSFHLKDATADGKRDTELGSGTFDFRKFLRAVNDVAHKPCFVEQEAPTDELASAKKDWKYLSTLEW